MFLTSHSYFLYLGISLFLSLCRNKQLEKVSGIWHSFTRKVNCRKILVVLFTEAKDLYNFSLYVSDCPVLSTLAILFARRHVLGFPSILVLATPFVASLRLNAQRILQTIYSCTINYTKQKMVGHLTSRYACFGQKKMNWISPEWRACVRHFFYYNKLVEWRHQKIELGIVTTMTTKVCHTKLSSNFIFTHFLLVCMLYHV